MTYAEAIRKLRNKMLYYHSSSRGLIWGKY
mgnify:CR=1 FL=1